MKKKFIIIAMSGGIDSTVTAWILKKMKYNLKAIFMINWKDNLCYKNNLIDVIKICNILNIKLEIVNYEKFYKKNIFKNFIKNYKIGITPNPDVECNKKIKFKILLNYAIKLGAYKLATGHYAKIKKIKNNYLLFNSKDKKKDQTYFLYKLNKFQLSKLIFPLSNLYKSEIRLIAKKLNFPNKYKKDSYGICFIEKYNFKNFLNTYIKKKFGYILNSYNIILGIHDGIYFYTIGQKKNIKIQEKKKISFYYVGKKNKKNNIIYVSININNLWLLSIGLIAYVKKWIKKPKNRTYCKSKIKHSKNYIISFIRYINKNLIIVKFNKLQWGISPGQSIVFYINNICLGGGEIKNSINIL